MDFIFIYINFINIKMKSLVEYINERGPAPFRLKCSESGNRIPDNIVLGIAIENENSIKRIFNKLENKEFGNDNEYVICKIIETDSSYYNIVDTSNIYKYESSDNGIIVNVDDDREIYNYDTILNDNIGIVVFNRKKFNFMK